MNLTSLRYFVAVVEAGSMREAAEGLHVAQSALSRQIQNLEQAFGAPLLSRLPRGIAPTMAGRVLLRHARDTLSAVALAHDEIAALQGLRRGEIRIATIDPLAEDILPGLITRFQARHADISFDVRVGNTRQVQGLVREGLAEIGIGYNPPPDPDLAVLTAVDQPLTAFVAPDHPLAAQPAIALEALEGCRLILPPARSPTRRLIDEAMRRQGVTARVAVESDSVALRLNTAARTQAVALLAELSGRTAVAQGRLAGVPIADPAVENGSIQIFALKARQRSRAVTAFLRGLQMAIRHAR
ncbi:LysR family transcriptional regulator [Xanthobacter aminoxidans]|uniref:LysR family transcriptional regulator n=1 Tax=Xanthobacter aminoxidans TaxID=186280 RepID=A0ABW6ZJ35_9HYPH